MNRVRTRIASALLLLALPSLVQAEAERTEDRAQMPLPFKPDDQWGSFIGCLRPALATAGDDWPCGRLKAFLGPAFAFSMNPDGADVWQAGNYEWAYFFPMLNHFGTAIHTISGNRAGQNSKTVEEFLALKKEAWQRVRQSIDRGMPAIVWQAMTKAQKEADKQPLPFMWSLIVGYDEKAETYTVHHGRCGEFTIRWDALGHADPINWFCVVVINKGAKLQDPATAHSAALTHALEASQGKHPGGEAPAHGLAAFEMWLKAFREGKVKMGAVKRHADFLICSRTDAAAYLNDIKACFSEAVQKLLSEAHSLYQEEVQNARDLAALCSSQAPDPAKAAELVSALLEKERGALSKIKAALEGR